MRMARERPAAGFAVTIDPHVHGVLDALRDVLKYVVVARCPVSFVSVIAEYIETYR